MQSQQRDANAKPGKNRILKLSYCLSFDSLTVGTNPNQFTQITVIIIIKSKMKLGHSIGAALMLLTLHRCVGTEEKEAYGVDVSFPIHHGLSENYPGTNAQDMPLQILGDKKTLYDDFLNGCREFYNKNPNSCDGKNSC